MSDKKIPDVKSDQDLLEEARTRFQLCIDAESDLRNDALDDLKFYAGDQWPAEARSERERDRRPCLTINRLPSFAHQVENEQRQNRPAIKVHPADDLADTETAEIYQGLIRHIENQSNSEVAYDTAFASAIRSRRGFFRVITDYRDPLSFKQEILIKRIRNPLTVSIDPNSKEPDGSDMNFAFISEDLSKDEFKAQYPDADPISAELFQTIGDNEGTWFRDGYVRVIEYFYREFKDVKICLLSNGETIKESEVNQYIAQKALLGEPVEVVSKRTTKLPVIKWCKLNGAQILQKRDWPGRWIPIFPVIGEEIDVDGKVILKGLISDAKDPQKMLNYWKSAETEMIALAPKSPFVGAEGQFEGFEQAWATANIKNHAFLQYKPITLNGQMAPPPQRNSVEPAVQAISMSSLQAKEDLKEITGIYDSALGARSNESSGIAIQRRANQAQTSNYHFVDNLNLAIKHCGRVIVDLIPKIYDVAETVRILGDDSKQKMVRINEVFETSDGSKKAYFLGQGKYDVTMDVGPGYETKRQEAAQSMIEMSRVAPQIMEVAPDLIVRAMDWPGATDVANRLQKTLPPDLIDDNKKKIPPAVQAQMQQMQQMVDALTKQLNEAQDTIDTKRMELESKERIEFAKMQVDLEIQMAKLGTQESIELLRQEIAQIEGRLQRLNYNEPIEDERSEHMNELAPHEQQEQNNFGAVPAGDLPPENMPTSGPSLGNPVE